MEGIATRTIVNEKTTKKSSRNQPLKHEHHHNDEVSSLSYSFLTKQGKSSKTASRHGYDSWNQSETKGISSKINSFSS